MQSINLTVDKIAFLVYNVDNTERGTTTMEMRNFNKEQLMNVKFNFWVKLANGETHYCDTKITSMNHNVIDIQSDTRDFSLKWYDDTLRNPQMRDMCKKQWYSAHDCFCAEKIDIIEIYRDKNYSKNSDHREPNPISACELIWSRERYYPNLNIDERNFVNSFDAKHADLYLARYGNGELWLSLRKPTVKIHDAEGRLDWSNRVKKLMKVDSDMFRFVTLNTQPYTIKELQEIVKCEEEMV